MTNNTFQPNEEVRMITYPHEEFIYITDDGKVAELLSNAGTIHYRRLEFLEPTTDNTPDILTGFVTVALSPRLGGA